MVQAFLDSGKFIFLRESPDGVTLLNLQDGREMFLCGPEVAPASRSQSPENGEEKRISAISGPKCDGLLTSASLQSSLESRLRVRMDGCGSPEYDLTWKRWDMPSGPQICARRASVRRTSGRGCTGWPSPKADDIEETVEIKLARIKRIAASGKTPPGFPGTLTVCAQLVGWQSPSVEDDNRSGSWENYRKYTEEGQTSGCRLRAQIWSVAGWPTPNAEAAKEGMATGRQQSSLGQTVTLSGLTPSSSNAATPTSPATPDTAEYRLNPLFSLWLQGYPEEWACSGE